MVVKKTYPKILLLIFSSSIFFVLLYFSLYYYINQVEKQVYKNTTEHFFIEVNKLFELDTQPITVSINNDTNWDEFVNFVDKKDIAWYNKIIAEELNIYRADYMVAYDVNRKFITHTTTPKIKSINFIPEKAMLQLNTVGLSKFYINIPEGIVEVFGAAVHPSFDLMKNKSKVRGYFFVVRLMDTEYLKDLEKFTNSKIQFANSQKEEVNGQRIFATVDLKNHQNKVIKKLLFIRNSAVYFEKIMYVLYLIILAFVINLIINVFYTKKLVYYPLDLITKALEAGDKKAIRTLKRTTGEFRYIGTLFQENSNQKIELVKAKLNAEEGDRLKSSFLANLSHEIRTPMNAINGFTDLLLNTQLSEAEKLQYLKIIDKSGKNLVSIIDDLIEMSKIDSNQITPNYTNVNLESCINEIFSTINITIPKSKKIDFYIIENPNPLAFNIITDEVKLKQVIVNLVTNAIKFTDTGHVAFGYKIDKKRNKIVFTIKDTGLGIDEHHHKHIFDRFKRVDSDTSIKAGGLGLGLAISKAYVEMMGGIISLESKVEKGSVFSFSIPLKYDDDKKITVQPIVNAIADSKGTEEGTILIAEDDNINFLLFQKIMQVKNYKILRAVNGQEAVDICINNPNIGILLMDIKMPVMNGFEALEKIRVIRPDLIVIAQTAYSSSDDKEKMIQAGFYGCITKPINREKLFELLNQVL